MISMELRREREKRMKQVKYRVKAWRKDILLVNRNNKDKRV